MPQPTVIKARPLPGHCLELHFNNGACGLLDMTPYLDFGVFARLKDPQSFDQVRVLFDTVEWPCGVDLDPAFVYAKAQIKAEE